MNKSTAILTVTVVGLSIACIGLLIALFSGSEGPQNERSSEKPRDLGAPIISSSTNEDYDAEIEENAKAEDDWDDEETIGKFVINVFITKIGR